MPPQNKNIEIIREKVIACNPSILELKFGCEMEWKTKEGEKFMFLDMTHEGVLQVKFPNGTIGLRSAMITDCEILGRPITLADILQTISQNSHPGEVLIYEMNSYFEFFFGDKAQGAWDLRKSFEDQTPECHQFLADLLS